MYPEAFVNNVVDVWGEHGSRWLTELPDILGTVTVAWGLTIGAPYELSFSYVTTALRDDGTPAVLKLLPPGVPELRTEIAALTAYSGRGAVRVLRADLDRGALLLERLEPGWRLRDLVKWRDVEATSVAVGLLRKLHAPPPPDHRLPDLASYRKSFDEYLARYAADGPLPRDLVVRATGLFGELRASAPAPVVLHGDLHHDNILRAEREPWLAIDPHGVVGDPGFEIGPLLYNPDPRNRDPTLTALVPARVEQIADELAMPIERVVAWGFVAAVLSELWTALAPGAAARGPSPVGRALDTAHLLLPRLS